MKNKTKEKYNYFLSLTREDEPRPLNKIPFDINGEQAIESFHNLETHGKLLPTKEPLLLERYLAGKAWHGVTVDQVSQSLIDGTITTREIWENYRDWVGNEIFSSAEKKCKLNGYTPKYISNRKDYSECNEDDLIETIK